MTNQLSPTILATSEQVVLRRLETSDLADFQVYRTDPDVAKYQSWEFASDEKARSFLEEMSTAGLLVAGVWCQIGIAMAGTNQLIGDIGVRLDNDHGTAEIGITLSPTSQRRGLATDAVRSAFRWIFTSSEADRVYGIADKRNTASIELMKRLGMNFEDEYETVFEGEDCVEIRYAMTKQLFAGSHASD